MKVLLIYPGFPSDRWPRGSFRSHWVPAGISHIAYVLEDAGCAVRILNGEELLIQNNYNGALVDEIIKTTLAEFVPDFVGLSIVTPSMIEAARIAGYAKEVRGGETLVIAGGPHPTALPERTLREIPELDAVVVGEGETTMLEIVQKGLGDSVPGLAFRRGAEFVRTGPRTPEMDLDKLGVRPYHLFNMKFYTEPNPWMIPWLNLKITNLRTSRGCVGNCKFCAGPLVSGHGIRYHSIEYVTDQFKRVVEEFGVEAIHFEDESIGADPNRLVLLCEKLRRTGLSKIRWSCRLRVDQTSPELLQEMKSAGCMMVEYGFETGSDRMLRAIGKKTTMEQNRRAAVMTREAGLRIFADIMVGLPGETSADWAETVDFLRWAKPDVIFGGLLCPLPGTPLFNQLPSELRDSIKWEDYTYLETLDLGLNLSSIPTERLRSKYRAFNKYLLQPHAELGMIRDSGREEVELRKMLRKKMISFAVRHPVRAARLPYPWREVRGSLY